MPHSRKVSDFLARNVLDGVKVLVVRLAIASRALGNGLLFVGDVELGALHAAASGLVLQL